MRSEEEIKRLYILLTEFLMKVDDPTLIHGASTGLSMLGFVLRSNNS